jgi:hypothetical protein
LRRVRRAKRRGEPGGQGSQRAYPCPADSIASLACWMVKLAGSTRGGNSRKLGSHYAAHSSSCSQRALK